MMKISFSILLLLSIVAIATSFFISARQPSTPVGGRVRSAIIGDYGRSVIQSEYAAQYNNETGESRVADMIKNKPPFFNAALGTGIEFITTNGDNNYPVGGWDTIDDNVGQFFREYISPYNGNYTRVSTSTTNMFFPTIGNHAFYYAGDAYNVTANPYAYLKYFKGVVPPPGSSAPSSSNGRYYDFVWKDLVHFFALNSNFQEPDGITVNSKQAQWLKAALATSTAPFRVVYMHHMPYSNDMYDGPTPELRWPFRQWGASVVISGHSHCYQKFYIDGFQYLVNGLGGTVPIYPANPPDTFVPGTQVFYNDTWGAQLLEADACSMNISFHSIDGKYTDVVNFYPVVVSTGAGQNCEVNPNNNNNNNNNDNEPTRNEIGSGVAIGVGISVGLFALGYAAMAYWKKNRATDSPGYVREGDIRPGYVEREYE